VDDLQPHPAFLVGTASSDHTEELGLAHCRQYLASDNRRARVDSEVLPRRIHGNNPSGCRRRGLMNTTLGTARRNAEELNISWPNLKFR
jgi:hypothetical protein